MTNKTTLPEIAVKVPEIAVKAPLVNPYEDAQCSHPAKNNTTQGENTNHVHTHVCVRGA